MILICNNLNNLNFKNLKLFISYITSYFNNKITLNGNTPRCDNLIKNNKDSNTLVMFSEHKHKTLHQPSQPIHNRNRIYYNSNQISSSQSRPSQSSPSYNIHPSQTQTQTSNHIKDHIEQNPSSSNRDSSSRSKRVRSENRNSQRNIPHNTNYFVKCKNKSRCVLH